MILKKNGNIILKAGKVVNFLVDHALGLGNTSWFYRMFIGKGASSIEEVKKSLQNAWWLCREDLVQVLYLMLLENESLLEESLGRIRMSLSVRLRDYLLYKERVFTRRDTENLSSSYPVVTPQKDVFFSNKNLYIKYLAYLKNRYSVNQIVKILCLNRRSVINDLERIKGDLL